MKEKFHGILDYKKDVLEQNLTNLELLDLLVKHGILFKSNEDKSDKVKSLNRMYRPVDNEHLVYATIIFRGNCYFLSDDYINEAVNFILHHAFRNGNEYLKSRVDYFRIRNEAFIDFEDKKEFYKKELEALIQKKYHLTRNFEIEDFDDENNLFSEKVKEYLELNLHGNPEFNSRYIYGFQNLKRVNISSYFENIEELVYLKRLIDYVKNELGSLVSNTSDSENEYHFKKEYLSFFTSEIGFKIFVECIERIGVENLGPAKLMKLKELFESKHFKLKNLDLVRLGKKAVSRNEFLTIANDVTGRNFKSLNSVKSSTDPNINKIFESSILYFIPSS